MTQMNYHHTQRPTWVVLLALGMLAVAAVVYQSAGWHVALVVPTGVALIVTCLFGALAVEVTDETIRLSFGIGLIRKTIRRSDVAAAKPVRTSWIWGWGIRLTPDGWLWNISGRDAVELRYTNGKTFRIGTDDQAGLLQALGG